MCDSDSDPTWRPYYIAKKGGKRRKKKVRSPILRIKKILKENGESSWTIVPRTRRHMASKNSFNCDNEKSPIQSQSSILESFTCPIDAKLLALIRDPNIDISPFESGEFIMKKPNLEEKYPPLLWRIDGKTVLQKFEPFELDGKIFYRNKATYAGFCTKNRHLAQRASVKICEQNNSEIIVEFSNETK